MTTTVKCPTRHLEWEVEEDEEEEEGGEVFDDDNWASVVDIGADERFLMRKREEGGKRKRDGKRERRSGYFSDESDY
ncbi:hypothetical protein RHGRI_027387 [Rhododendron griersonianum]|uniref:Uncharacterized protein n=1 Tax=Rhododendron griersonianum TaxID=479676 RepID=A0AAV6IXZ3_9ERIC|nr:hypothetical protein RHGRI_027387 [Rhododendron griersonianum]